MFPKSPQRKALAGRNKGMKITKKGWVAVNGMGNIIYCKTEPQIYLQKTKPIVKRIRDQKEEKVVRCVLTYTVAPPHKEE